jgi:glutamyl/glutaminyl-tRNA synthetase
MYLHSIKNPIHSRIAPTPSGFFFFFFYTKCLFFPFDVDFGQKTSGTLTLRIDDIGAENDQNYLQDVRYA